MNSRGMSRDKQKRVFGRSVDVTIYGISAELAHEFGQYVIKPYYPGGISPAIKDLMRKAVEEEKRKKSRSKQSEK